MNNPTGANEDREKYLKWHLLDDVPEEIYLHSIHDTVDGFQVALELHENANQLLLLNFGEPFSTRVTNSSYLMKTIHNAEREPFPFYTVKNSKWQAWFHENTYGIHEQLHPIHSVLATPEEWVEVIHIDKPKYTWIARDTRFT